ncbi:MAG: hypothetical protein JSS02_13590, partial [Planctomycetes bacterium]|nr:hypothetical protein [Planctomycetota bacterium]
MARIGYCWLAVIGTWLGAHTANAQEKPAITIIFPGMDTVFEDVKLAFDLVGEKGDDKGFETLKSTIETFLVGIDTSKQGGVRVYP